MKTQKLKKIVSGSLLLLALTVLYGSMVTVHATTPHNCPRAVLSNGQFVDHPCTHDSHKKTMDAPYPVLHNRKLTAAMDDPNDPEYDPGMIDFNSPCSCPWWCFFGGGGYGGTGFPSTTSGSDLHWSDLFSKRGLEKVTAHGLFYHGK